MIEGNRKKFVWYKKNRNKKRERTKSNQEKQGKCMIILSIHLTIS